MMRRSGVCLLIVLFSVVTVISGCSDPELNSMEAPPVATAGSSTEDDSSAGDAAAEKSGELAGDVTTREYAGISFDIPAAWSEIPNQTMVDSKYIVHTAQGDMELTLTSMGGGIEANLNRWVGQVGQAPGDEPTWSTVDVAGIESRMVDVRGSFDSRLPGQSGTQDNWRLIGIAVPLPRDFFVKLVGPREAVAEFQDDLTVFLKTAKQP
ncbi:hypothetical protein GC176_20180 [bacterium]|nr:hypothetical protein [bacterium]